VTHYSFPAFNAHKIIFFVTFISLVGIEWFKVFCIGTNLSHQVHWLIYILNILLVVGLDIEIEKTLVICAILLEWREMKFYLIGSILKFCAKILNYEVNRASLNFQNIESRFINLRVIWNFAWKGARMNTWPSKRMKSWQ